MRLRLHTGRQRAGLKWLVKTGDNELKGYRRKLSGKGMRNLRDLAVILPRAGQMRYAV